MPPERRRACSVAAYWIEEGVRTHFEEGEVDLLGVGVLLLVHTSVEILHIQDNTQEPVHFLLRNILEVGDVVAWGEIQTDVNEATLLLPNRNKKPKIEFTVRLAHPACVSNFGTAPAS